MVVKYKMVPIGLNRLEVMRSVFPGMLWRFDTSGIERSNQQTEFETLLSGNLSGLEETARDAWEHRPRREACE